MIFVILAITAYVLAAIYCIGGNAIETESKWAAVVTAIVWFGVPFLIAAMYIHH